MMEPCTHGMPKPENCFECMEEGNLPTPASAPVVPKVVSKVPIQAKFDGECSQCSEEILMGDLIVLLTNSKWIHDSPCAIDLDRVDD